MAFLSSLLGADKLFKKAAEATGTEGLFKQIYQTQQYSPMRLATRGVIGREGENALYGSPWTKMVEDNNAQDEKQAAMNQAYQGLSQGTDQPGQMQGPQAPPAGSGLPGMGMQQQPGMYTRMMQRGGQ